MVNQRTYFLKIELSQAWLCVGLEDITKAEEEEPRQRRIHWTLHNLGVGLQHANADGDHPCARSFETILDASYSGEKPRNRESAETNPGDHCQRTVTASTKISTGVMDR